MKIPALRANIGDWTYYVTTLTFEQVRTHVSQINQELHKSESLRDLIQRSISSNYLDIKSYILNQPELFFNSLVLAVYDDYPDWREIEFTYEGEETYQMGLLEFPGAFKIFPVDGQHRVEGIKAALEERPELKDQRIAAVFIGHKNDRDGMQRTRRLFTTLNRYAKPVSLDDIIALDEDDSVAIVTRFLLEDYDLFSGKRVAYAKQKAIPPNNHDAITSIITLYQANLELFKTYYSKQFHQKATPKKLEEYLKFRPPQENIDGFQAFCVGFWDAFKTNVNAIADYLAVLENPAADYRNNESGGHLLFRPIGFLPFVKASLIIEDRTQTDFAQIFERFSVIDLDLNRKPWHFVAWNPTTKSMIMRSDSVILLLLIFMYDKDLLTAAELKAVKQGYASKIAYEGDEPETVLDFIA
jgi:DNA sulfur modification protein DndB